MLRLRIKVILKILTSCAIARLRRLRMRDDVKILVAGDDDQRRTQLMQRLEAAGCSVTIAANGLIADRLSQQSQFDVLVTDILMPEMDGLELIRSVRGRNNGVRIVAMLDSGASHNEGFLRSLARTANFFGADAIVRDTASADALFAAIGGSAAPVPGSAPQPF